VRVGFALTVILVVALVVKCKFVSMIGLLDGREITGNVLIQQERFSFQSGENGNEIKVAERFLIPPFGGSNPPAPASQCGLHYAISGCVRTADIPAG
jgi:hypothetical protein